MDASSEAMGPLERIINEKLTVTLAPAHLHVVNESYKHNVPKGAESHFSVTIVSDMFTGKSLIERHRLVNGALSDELKDRIHALSIKAKTLEQWNSDQSLNTTPNCLGGSHK
jgi:stress-induced morphogen